MDNYQILNATLSSLTPIILIIIGIFINKNIEGVKHSLSKRQNWHESWANEFIKTSFNFSDEISNIVVNMHQFSQMDSEKLPGYDIKMKEKNARIVESIDQLQHHEYRLKTLAQFATQSGAKLLEKKDTAFKKASDLIKNKHGNADDIMVALAAFNEAAKNTHAELLGLL